MTPSGPSAYAGTDSVGVAYACGTNSYNPGGYSCSNPMAYENTHTTNCNSWLTPAGTTPTGSPFTGPGLAGNGRCDSACNTAAYSYDGGEII